MKRTAKRIFFFVLLLFAAAITAAAFVAQAAQLPEQADSVLLTNRDGGAYSVSDHEFVANFLSMVQNAKWASPSKRGETVCTAGAGGKTISIIRFGEGYAVDGLLPRKLDTDSFSSLAARLAAAQKPAGELPVLTAVPEGDDQEGTELPPSSVLVQVLGIDGAFYPSASPLTDGPAEGEPAALHFPHDTPVTFAFSAAPDRLDAALWLNGEKDSCQ